MLCCAFTQLSACRLGNMEISMERNELTSYKNVFQINDEKYPVEIAKLYLCNYRNLYGKTNGLDLWQNSDTASLETYVKDVTIQELSRIVCMVLLAEEKGLELSEEEKEQAKKDMGEMLDYIDKLNELDTSGVEPMSHVFPVNNVFREDVVTNGDGHEATLANAPEVKENAFLVPKTV